MSALSLPPVTRLTASTSSLRLRDENAVDEHGEELVNRSVRDRAGAEDDRAEQ